MDLIKVDPQLFIVCRLCLDESGTYQLTPSVLHQIKYCFDIEVNQFDGLPQLICEKCQSKLSEYYTMKMTYIGKQNALRAKLAVRKELEIETRASSASPNQPTESSLQAPETIRTTQRRPKKRILNSLSISSDELSLDSNSKKTSKKTSKTMHTPAPWELSFTKHFVCKLCGKSCKLKSGLYAHLRKHNNLISKYNEVIGRQCTVQLNKVDDHPSLTGDKNTVVYDHNMITQNESNIHYYVVYLGNKKIEKGKNGLSIVAHLSGHSPEESEQLQSSDDEIIVKGKKRRRILSRSSDGTIVLENQNKSGQKQVNSDLKEFENNDNDFITLEDSSDSDTEASKSEINLRSKKGSKTNIKATTSDCKGIQSIINISLNKYLKKKESQSLEAQLKHKILNIGTKVITSPSFVCTGLLRFIEFKNLGVNWKNNTITPSSNKELNYIRIMPRLRDKHMQEKTDNTWYSLLSTEITQQKDSAFNSIPQLELDKPNSPTEYVLKENPIATSVANSVQNTILVNKVVGSKEKAKRKEHTLLYYESNGENDMKLLNANPVAHPRKLPKKHNNNIEKLKLETVPPSEKTELINESICLDGYDDTDIFMPIIMSTTSLATPKIEQNITEGPVNKPELFIDAAKLGDGGQISNHVNENESSNNGDKTADNSIVTNCDIDKERKNSVGRIKVKPVSELMSEKALNDFCQQQNFLLVKPGNAQQGSQIHVYEQRVEPSQLQSIAMAPAPPQQHIPVLTPLAQINSEIQITKTSREYVILDTVQLPNTKTDSPIKYIQNLLTMHDIVLMQTKEKIPAKFVCLIKFKLQFEQETINHPIIICLSLHCGGNEFILDVRDPSQADNINLDDLTANWQWEILKNFNAKEDVINKVINNAQKMSTEIYESTKRFISILSSINFRTVLN